MGGATVSGKGDDYRPTNYVKYNINYNKIDWGCKKDDLDCSCDIDEWEDEE